MCLKMSEEAHLIAPKPVRSSLNTATNAQPNNASLLTVDKTNNIIEKGKKVRRKSSFVRRLDSSEDLPSSHDSIFIAEYLSPYNSEDSVYKTENWEKIEPSIPLSPRLEFPSLNLPSSSSSSSQNNDENGNARLSIGITPILYGHGTPLTTIIEQKSSNPTLRGEEESTTSATHSLVRPRSASDLTASSTPNSSLRLQRTSAIGGSPLRNLHFSTSGIIRRLESLSDNSVEAIKLSWPPGYDPQRASFRRKSSLDGGSDSCPTSPISQVYAQPLRPLQPPIDRPATPDGMPSWTAAQHRQPRGGLNPQGEVRRGWGIHEASSMLQRLFSNRSQHNGVSDSTEREGEQETATTRSGYGIRGPWDSVPGHRRIVAAPVLRGAPRFRPPRSAHGVAMLEMHPFARAGRITMGVKGDSVNALGIPMPVMPGIPPTPGFTMKAVTPEGGHVPVTLVDEGAVASGSATGHRSLSQRVAGRRKPGQRVRFTPSTADPSATIQRESGTFVVDVKVCPHKKKTASGDFGGTSGGAIPLAAVPVGEFGVPASVLQSPPRGRELERDGLGMHPVPPNHSRMPIWMAHGARSPIMPISPLDHGFKGRSKCWKCRLEVVYDTMDKVWDRTQKLMCWYCCGADAEAVEAWREGRPDWRNVESPVLNARPSTASGRGSDSGLIVGCREQIRAIERNARLY